MKVHSNALLQRHSQVMFRIQYNIHQLSYGPLCIENYISLIKSFDGYNICYLAYINFLRPLYTRSRRHEPYIIIWAVQITCMTASTINQYLLVHINKICYIFQFVLHKSFSLLVAKHLTLLLQLIYFVQRKSVKDNWKTMQRH